jgi:hypothetical protein
MSAQPAAGSSGNDRFFLTESETDGKIGADRKPSRNLRQLQPPKQMCFKEPSAVQMGRIREISDLLSQKMKVLVELTRMLASQALDDQNRQLLRNELESTKAVCQEMKAKLELLGIAKPRFQFDIHSLEVENKDLIRRLAIWHPLQLLLARTVASLDSRDAALLKRTQSQLQTSVANINSFSRKSINQLNAAKEIADIDKKSRQQIWMKCTFLIISVYRFMAARPTFNGDYQARTIAACKIKRFLRQKMLSKSLTRQARAVRVLAKAVRYFLNWKLRMSKKNESTIIIKRFLIELRDVHPAAKAIKKFRKRVISIQKMIRHFLMRRNFLYMRLLHRWIKLEEKERKRYNGMQHLVLPLGCQLTWHYYSSCEIQI